MPRTSSVTISAWVGIALASLAGCRRAPERDRGTPAVGSGPGVASAGSIASAGTSASASATPSPASPPRTSQTFALTVASGNATPPGEPNVWAYVPAAYRADRPLSLVFVFHGFENCLRSLVAETGAPCRPGGPARTSLDLRAQIDRSGTGAITVVPQLAYDAKSGDPGALGSGAALERLAKELVEGPLASALGNRTLADVDRVATIAISAGFLTTFATLGAFPGKLRDVYLLDAYYVEGGPVDAFLFEHLSLFARNAPRPRRLGVVHSALEATRAPAAGLATRASAALAKAGLASSFVRRVEPGDPTVEELAAPVSIVRSHREHDEIPRVDIEKVLAALGT